MKSKNAKNLNWVIAKEKLPRATTTIGKRYFLVETLGGSYEVGQYFKGANSRWANKEDRQDRFAKYVIPGNYWGVIHNVVRWIEIK